MFSRISQLGGASCARFISSMLLVPLRDALVLMTLSRMQLTGSTWPWVILRQGEEPQVSC